MRFDSDDASLRLWLELEPGELPAVDLTRGGLGSACLDALTDSLREIWGTRGAAAGQVWAPLKPSSRAHKGGRSILGYDTGSMLGQVDPGRRVVVPRRATWQFPQGDRFEAARAFHNGRPNQAARRWFVWTDRAADLVVEILKRW